MSMSGGSKRGTEVGGEVAPKKLTTYVIPPEGSTYGRSVISMADWMATRKKYGMTRGVKPQTVQLLSGSSTKSGLYGNDRPK